MAIDISGISNPVSGSSAYDADNPTKWTEELSIFYLKVFDEIQQNNDGILDDFSALSDGLDLISAPMESLENTLSGRGESGEDQYSSWFSSVFSEVDSLLTEVSEVWPAEYADLPSTIKDGLPAIPVPAGGVVGVIMYAIKAFLLLQRIKGIIDLVRGRTGGAGDIEDKLDTIIEVLQNAFLFEDPGNPGEYYSVLEQISQREQQINLEDLQGGTRIKIFPHTLSMDFEEIVPE